MQALLLDCDGLLVGTEALFTESETAIFSAHGRQFTPAHKAKLLGRPPPAVGLRMAEMLGVPEHAFTIADELMRQVRELVRVPLRPLADVAELLASVNDAPIIVLSNSPRELV